MDNRERTKAILKYEKYDRMPAVHFGYWKEVLEKWHLEGHLNENEIKDVWDGSKNERIISKKLGFDYNWFTTYQTETGMSSLYPQFEIKYLKEYPDGKKEVLGPEGSILLIKEGLNSVPAEIDHVLKDRKSWEANYLPRLQYSDDRISEKKAKKMREEYKDQPFGIYCGSLYGQIRNWLGIEKLSYLYLDDEELFDEIINTVGDLSYKVTKKALETGVKFDFAHFWEDICFKNGPLVQPDVYRKKVGPHYKRITDLVRSYGIDIISLDSDGKIDDLIPIWIDNGINTMFPIEVGTWKADISKWKEKYSKQIRGVGGMNKHIFAKDYKAIDEEIERLKKLINYGGYIPCPDHRISDSAKWENVQYYCDKIKEIHI